jgi:biopolymer transport protein ExbD
MRFPRNTKIFRGQLDAAPYAGVFFLLVIFLLLNSSFVFTPGIPIALPDAPPLPGAATPTLAVAIDESSRIYFDNQVTSEAALKRRLSDAVAATPDLTLVIQAHKNVTWNALARVMLVAREAGVKTALPATRPPVVPAPYNPVVQ